MPGDYLLDANIVIAIFNGDQSAVANLRQGTVFLSTIVLGELYYGAIQSSQSLENQKPLSDFADRFTVLPVSRVTSLQYGAVKGQLRRIGRPIPDNDIWIAACAREHGLILATRDEHFSYVEGLSVSRW
ncbi:MAG: VapC toxin family PIN domain ribonuclease [Planctomycetota bacterium]|nr:MAG: VapC toxin family PIN domain ribonuclease [Planctomycetota bacterium]